MPDIKIGTESCETDEDRLPIDFDRKIVKQSDCFFHHGARVAPNKLELTIGSFVAGLFICQHSEVDLCESCNSMVNAFIKRLSSDENIDQN